MKRIIDIPDELLSIFEKHGIMAFDYFNEYDKDQIAIAITHGTPLPKGHGDLIDRDELSPKIHGAKSIVVVLDAPAIVEADKENDNGQIHN